MAHPNDISGATIRSPTSNRHPGSKASATSTSPVPTNPCCSVEDLRSVRTGMPGVRSVTTSSPGSSRPTNRTGSANWARLAIQDSLSRTMTEGSAARGRRSSWEFRASRTRAPTGRCIPSEKEGVDCSTTARYLTPNGASRRPIRTVFPDKPMSTASTSWFCASVDAPAHWWRISG